MDGCKPSLARGRMDLRLSRLLHLPRAVASESEEDPHHLVAAIGGGVEHAGAAAVNDGNSMLAAVGGRRRRDASSAGAAVHPYVLDADVRTLAHRCFCPL